MPGDVTQILNSVEDNDSPAAEELLPLVYDELRQLAAYRMAQESPGNTLQATALVHEAYVKLVQGNQAWQNRKHFFAAAAEAMRRLLVERARRKKRLKHGGELEKIPLDDIEIRCSLPSEKVLALHEALEKLEVEDPRGAQLVKLRFFAGLSQKEVAESLNISTRTADNIWAFARAWLYSEINLS